ncbi:MAG: lipopolysaccharide core heptose(I) kinase RfaP [Deltaproteobacteria bacterium]|nr:MAG: lipopolysaccharide core heptose(I) kinase RfaP [Deltaproteobacteria bacterium]
MDLRPDLRRHFPGSEAEVFDRVMSLEGEVFRSVARRRTLRFTLDGKGYFVKIHQGVGWNEIVKNLLQLRLPVLGAANEWRAIRRLEELGVATMAIAGFGERGVPPARLQSFLITDELTNTVSLEDFCRDWPVEPPPVRLKRALIEKVANVAERLHNSGVNHRDFYICHFLLDRDSVAAPFTPERLTLSLIDLHRVQMRSRTPRRWLVKDLAALHFSSMDIGLTRRDLLRFLRVYRNRPLRETLGRERRFWKAVEKKARWLYQHPC